jgi:hypothetical protein
LLGTIRREETQQAGRRINRGQRLEKKGGRRTALAEKHFYSQRSQQSREEKALTSPILANAAARLHKTTASSSLLTAAISHGILSPATFNAIEYSPTLAPHFFCLNWALPSSLSLATCMARALSMFWGGGGIAWGGAWEKSWARELSWLRSEGSDGSRGVDIEGVVDEEEGSMEREGGLA